MLLDSKNQFVIILFLVSLLLSGKAMSNEYFDPFVLIRNTPQGKQLLDISKNAEFDVELAQQQLKALIDSGVRELGIEYQVAEILAEISIYHQLSDIEKINTLLTQLELLGTKPDNDWILSKYFEQKAVLALKQGHFLTGFDDANKAIELAQPLNYQEVVANAKSLRGLFYGKQGNGSNALEDYLSAITFFEKSNNLKRLSAIYNNLVVLYIDRKSYDKALTISDRAIAIHDKLTRKSDKTTAINYLNRAIILSHVGTKDEELQAFIEAQKYAIKSNNIGILTSVYANLSDYFMRYKNYTIAVERAQKCLETSAKIKDRYTSAICLLNKGLSLIYLDNASVGLDDLNQALSIVEAENMQSTLVDVYHSFVMGYQHIKDHKSANVWLTKYYELLLKQAKHDKENYFKNVEESFKEAFSEREKLNTSLKSEMAQDILYQEAVIHRLWVVTFVLVIFLVISLVIIIRVKRHQH